MSEIQDFIDATVEPWRRLYHAYALAEWEAATTGTPEANHRNQEAQAALMRFWSDAERYTLAKRLFEAGLAPDPLQARQVKLIYLRAAEYQQDEAMTARLTELEADLRDHYYNFRGQVGGQALSDNELDEILAKSADSAQVREAWEASKQIGAQAADRLRDLARARNAAARAQGYRDYVQRQLLLNEIDEAELLALFDRLQAATDAPFARLKAEIDRLRAARFGLEPGQLQPWHFGDRFFQRPPDLGQVNLDALLDDQDPVSLALATYDGLGMDVRDILERSDLYARPGKNQHAFCLDLDHDGDVRTLNNLERNHRWNETLLHELGHAVYDKYQNRNLPWPLRTPPHVLSTEAVALLMGSLASNAEWLVQIAGVPSSEVEAVSRATRAQGRAERLLFTRWALVMTHFERALYADPDGDLDSAWWDLVARYQDLRCPPGRQAPDWAAKIHVALYPVYYHNYELGYLVAAQLEASLQRHAGGLVGRPAAGAWLLEKYFWPGNQQDWSQHVTAAAGEPLNPQYFVEALGETDDG